MDFDPNESLDIFPAYEARKKNASANAPRELLLLFSEAAGMLDARWGNLVTPEGNVFRNFCRCSRPGFSPRFGSGNSSAPRPAEDGLEVCREEDGWLLELVFDDRQMTYKDLSERLNGVVEIIRHG